MGSTVEEGVEVLDKAPRLVELTPVEQGLAQLRADLAGVEFDVTTTKGDKAAREARSRCVAIRTGAKKAYEAWNAPMLAKQRDMRAEVARITSEVEAIEEPIDAQIKAQEAKVEAEREAKREAERQRLQKIQNAIEGLRAHAAAAVGKSSADVRAIIDSLTAREITLDEFADHTGQAELVKAETLDKLAEVLAAAEAHAAELARLKAERDELAKLRAEQEERERAAAAKAAEEAQAAAAARAAEDARIQAERDKLAQEQRAAQEAREQAEAEARAKQDAAAKKLADERAAFEAEKAAEAKRQQDAFEAEERRIAEQEAAEAKRRQDEEAERVRVEQEAAQAENRAARLAPGHTGGTWSIGRAGSVVTDQPIPGMVHGSGHDEVEYYGGHLLAESIYRPADAWLMSMAPHMLELLRQFVEQITDPANADHTLGAFARGARVADARMVLADAAKLYEDTPKA